MHSPLGSSKNIQKENTSIQNLVLDLGRLAKRCVKLNIRQCLYVFCVVMCCLCISFILPCLRIINGVLKTNIAFPGLKVESSIDDGKTWFDPEMASVVSGTILLRTR